jgi:predicted dehydrogenase
MAGKRIGIGFIGAEDISILHGAAINRLEDAELIGLWNRSEGRARERAEQLGCKIYRTPQELVEDPRIDAVFILTNLETHLEYCEMALRAGKHVMVEKPVSDSVANVERIRDMAARKGLVCVPGHNMIYEEGIHRSRDLIRNGDLGTVVSVYVMYNIHHPEFAAAKYPGVVRQILTHNLYSMMYLGGRPRRVHAFKARLHYEKLTVEDLAMVNVELESGALAHLCASYAADDLSADPWTFVVKVIGTAGTTRYSYQDWVEAKKGLVHSRTFTAYGGSVFNEDREFVNILLKGGVPRSTMEDAVIAQKAIEAIERSIETGQAVEV